MIAPSHDMMLPGPLQHLGLPPKIHQNIHCSVDSTHVEVELGWRDGIQYKHVIILFDDTIPHTVFVLGVNSMIRGTLNGYD
jgi:hypothetical protein